MPGSPLFEDLLDLADRPFLRCGNHANPSVVSHRDERMRADLLLATSPTVRSSLPVTSLAVPAFRFLVHDANVPLGFVS
jgi:hypothetical protein